MTAGPPVRLSLLAGVLLALPLAAGAAQRPEPPLSALVDSAALVQAVAALELPALPRGVPPLFHVHFDSTGAVAEVGPLIPGIPDAYADPVVEAIRAHALPQPPGRWWITRLRVVAGAGALVDRPELREEMPRLRNAPMFIGEVQRIARRHVRSFPVLRGEGLQAMVRLRVLPDGRPDRESVQVTRSTGSRLLDEELVRAAAVMRFTPARIEGIPVRVWVVQPVHLWLPPHADPRVDGTH
jgi:TonB family protein